MYILICMVSTDTMEWLKPTWCHIVLYITSVYHVLKWITLMSRQFYANVSKVDVDNFGQ